jgi:hypothetical protein|tara:strand:- start:175 stop:885 length:711 start_codon:yes stop_codon:yes gene_type:complete
VNKTYVKKQDICNLSRIPVFIDHNPIFLTASEILKNKNLKYENSTLFNHYSTFSKKLSTLSDFYSLDNHPVLKKYTYKNYFFPWYHKRIVTEFSDIAFIKERNLGFGLVQFEKIKSLIESIKKNGYEPDAFKDRKLGHITGYWISDEKEKKFFIVSGNHRISVLCALFPGGKFPVIYEQKKFMKDRDLRYCCFKDKGSHPKVFYSKDAKNWLSVKNKTIDYLTAIEIIRIFTRGII